MHPTIQLRIESLAYGGDAVAHTDDRRVVFLPFGCPGDTVAARVTEDHGSFLRGEISEIVEASPERRRPPCPYFEVCGGCQWQHVAHAAQVEAKRRAVTDALERIGGIESPPVGDVITAGAAYGYRNKIELRCATDPAGRLRLGMSARGTDEIVEIEACLLAPDRARKAPRALAGALRFLSRGGDIGLERVAVRTARHTGDLEVSLWGPPGPFPRQMAATTLSRAVRTTSLVRVLVSEGKRGRTSAKLEILGGSGTWKERLGGFAFRVSAPSFFQVNTEVAEALAGEVVRATAADGSDRVLDAYAGVGTFTLPLAVAAREVVAVEMTSAALRDLEHNLDSAGLEADVVGGDVKRELPALGRFDAIVLDPPRSGMAPDALAAVLGAAPKRIVYVSCDPATLARDARTLCSSGYALGSAVPVDLFPQTFHVETVATFDRA